MQDNMRTGWKQDNMRERWWTKYMNNITQWDHQNKNEINTNIK